MRGYGRDAAIFDGDVTNRADVILRIDDVPAFEQQIVGGLAEPITRHAGQSRQTRRT